jgi:hypothetical protein
VTGKSWKKAIIELGTPAAWGPCLSRIPVSALPTVDINAFSSEPSVESKRSGRGTAAVLFPEFRSDGRRCPAIRPEAPRGMINIAHLLRAKGDRYDEANVEEGSNH